VAKVARGFGWQAAREQKAVGCLFLTIRENNRAGF